MHPSYIRALTRSRRTRGRTKREEVPPVFLIRVSNMETDGKRLRRIHVLGFVAASIDVHGLESSNVTGCNAPGGSCARNRFIDGIRRRGSRGHVAGRQRR